MGKDYFINRINFNIIRANVTFDSWIQRYYYLQ